MDVEADGAAVLVALVRHLALGPRPAVPLLQAALLLLGKGGKGAGDLADEAGVPALAHHAWLVLEHGHPAQLTSERLKI